MPFMDWALATFLSQLAGDDRAQFAAFQSAFRERHPDVLSFASLTTSRSSVTARPALAEGGLTVVVLEQGPRLALGDFKRDELKDWYLAGITNDAVRNPQTFRDDGAEKAELQKLQPALGYGRAVGGASRHYTANFWRLYEIDLIERSVLGRIARTALPTPRSTSTVDDFTGSGVMR